MTPFDLENLPTEIHSPAAWHGPDLAARGDWVEQLSESDIAEIDVAASRLADAEYHIPSIRKTDFPLPTLGPRLHQILKDLLTGRGFVLLRRFPVERWSLRKTAMAYFGLGTHLGSARPRMRRGMCSGM